jgi:hypothetical protein
MEVRPLHPRTPHPLTLTGQIINPRSALLSNFEVLALLRELEVDHLSRTKTALRIKKEEESAGHASSVYARRESDSENLRTVEIEVHPRPAFCGQR